MTLCLFAMTVWEFETGRIVNTEDYPPAPVAWVLNALDLVCYPLQCSPWRQWLGVQDHPWLSQSVPSIRANMLDLSTYPEYLQANDTEQPYSLASLYKYAFQTPDTSLGELTTPMTFGVVLVLMLVIRAVKAVLLPLFCRMGREAGRRTHGKKWEAENEERITKFGEYVYRLFFHSAISALGIYYFYDKEWWSMEGWHFTGTRSLFLGYPNQPILPGMAWYYIIQSAYNLDAMVSLLEISFDVKFRSKGMPVRITWSKTVRGDFSEMLVHHVATNLLIFGSSHCRLQRVGSMVFLVHDLSDVPVDLSKLANFLKWKVTTIVCFFTMTLVWMITRLYLLPAVIVWSVFTESHYVAATDLPPLLYICHRHFFYVLLSLLILLHATWFTMFVRMFLTLVSKNEVHDYSEHKNGEEAAKGKKQK